MTDYRFLSLPWKGRVGGEAPGWGELARVQFTPLPDPWRGE